MKQSRLVGAEWFLADFDLGEKHNLQSKNSNICSAFFSPPG